MQKVLGLDIGSYSIKAVEIINKFNSYEISNFYETVIPNIEDTPPDAIIPVCMEQLFGENHIEADRIITAMPGQFISSRVLEFNFSDPRKIDASISLQLEEQVPFNMDDMVVDHQLLGTVGGKTSVLAVMTRKMFLRNFLDLLGRINIDPKLVDVDSLAFYNLCSHFKIGEDDTTAMLDLGHEKTSVCIIRGGLLKMFRSVNLGGRYITEYLARDMQVSFMEAQRIKHDISQILCENPDYNTLKGNDLEIARKITLATNSIIKELGRTFYSFKTTDKNPIERIYLSGGMANTKNLDVFMTEQFSIPCEVLDITGFGIDHHDELQTKISEVPQSLAIGLRAVSSLKKHSQINLRRGEFAYTQNYEKILEGATTALKIITIGLFLLLASYGIKYYFYSQKIDDLQAQYRKELFKSFPQLRQKYAKKKYTFKTFRRNAEKDVNKLINQKKDALLEFKQSTATSGALVTLRSISESLPKALKIDVTEYNFKSGRLGDGKLLIKAETDSYDMQSQIIDVLKSIPTLSNVEEKKSGPKPGSNGKVIEFTVTADYAPEGVAE